MPGDLRRVPDRHVILPVRGPEPAARQDAVAAPLDERPREIQKATLTGDAVQLDERHLDLGVAIDPDPGAWSIAERRLDRPGCPERDVEESVFAQAAMPRNGGLHQVPKAIELVAPLEVAI